jgi:hypothetical protein
MSRSFLLVPLFAVAAFSPSLHCQSAGVASADAFPGTSIHQKIANAFASQAGTQRSPAVSALVDLAPNRIYSFASPIEIPNERAEPYITRPVLDCNGSTLVYTGTGMAPAVLVHGENANNSANGSGELRNCTILRADVGGPIVLNNDRMGWHMTNVTLQGGQDNYVVHLTTTDGGPGYVEQSLLDNVGFLLAARDGIRVDCDHSPGEGCGYQYNFGRSLRFQFEGDGHSQIHFADGRINAFNGSYQTTVNTGGNGTTYFIRADPGAAVLSTFIEYNGEATAGAMVFKFGGGGVLDLQCRNLARTPFAYDSLAVCHQDVQTGGTGKGPYGFLLGSVTHTIESTFENGDRANGTYDNGDDWVRFHSVTNGVEKDHGIEQVLGCPTDANHPDPWDSTTCVNSLYHRGTGGWGVGPGFHDSTSSAEPQMKLDVHGDYGSSVQGTANKERTYWQRIAGAWTLVHELTTPPSAGGQPSAPEVWRYYSGGPNGGYVNGTTCQSVGDGHVDCTQNGSVNASGFSGNGNAGLTGTAVIGSCRLTINAGLITAKSGC